MRANFVLLYARARIFFRFARGTKVTGYEASLRSPAGRSLRCLNTLLQTSSWRVSEKSNLRRVDSLLSRLLIRKRCDACVQHTNNTWRGFNLLFDKNKALILT